MPSGRVPLTVKLSTSLPSRRLVKVRVADTILGLSASAIATSISPTATAFPPTVNVVAKSLPAKVLLSPSKSRIGIMGGTTLITALAILLSVVPSLTLLETIRACVVGVGEVLL